MNKLNKSQIICDFWATPILHLESLWSSKQLNTGKNNYFFFESDEDAPAGPIYVMTIGSKETVKTSDEGDSTYRINQLLESSPRPVSGVRKKSFKVWNSPLALEACLRLGITEKEYNETEKFQYVILTQNETIEFVTLQEPDWEIYKDTSLDDLVIQHLKKDSMD
jgi:hypothetical protein